MNSVITDTKGRMKMVMVIAISVAAANDESIGLALCLIFFSCTKKKKKRKEKKKVSTSTQRLISFPRQNDWKSELHILREFLISCGNNHESIGQYTTCLKYKHVSRKDLVVIWAWDYIYKKHTVLKTNLEGAKDKLGISIPCYLFNHQMFMYYLHEHLMIWCQQNQPKSSA